MTPKSVKDALTQTLESLWEANIDYNTIEGDTDLPPALHKTGQLVQLVGYVLQIIRDHLEQHGLGGLANIAGSFDDSNEKAKVLRDIFRELAPESETPRNDRYLGFMREKGRENAAENLMLKIMGNAYRVAKHETLAAATREYIKGLEDAMAELSCMAPSAPGDASNVFSSAGPQFNNTGCGKQFNNPGAGRQYQAEVMNFGVDD
ncbi:hypothetical protein MMYC01_208141 [Madurella mycetomatis]|uniref:NACHT-NTPase and P-loop NTPases N-terminal domain-containing protein n=1 Tax=Madurella mycetomatis TaxID=100816 RepID=A0A175VTE3_9PEZI|nr:hypothetical protein MMYC01_208141 [Madurella mycetomatis]